MKPHKIIIGDCLTVLRTMPESSVDSIVTDPPAGIGFMGKSWDHNKGGRAQWVAWMTEVATECLRVLKPGGHALVWSLPRTSHWTATAWEDAGFEVRDRVGHVFFTGFPKSMDVGKAIDKAAGVLFGGESVEDLKRCLIGLFNSCGKSRKRIDKECGFRASNYLTLHSELKKPDPWVNVLPSQEKWAKMKRVLGCDVDISEKLDSLFKEAERAVTGQVTKARSTSGKSALPTIGGSTTYETWNTTAPATDAAKQWEGWGTALKPAVEDWWLLRKPLVGTVAQNVTTHGTGALNIDGCRVELEADCRLLKGGTYGGNRGSDKGTSMFGTNTKGLEYEVPSAKGRWPAHLIHDGSDEVIAAFPDAPGQQGPALNTGEPIGNKIYGAMKQVCNSDGKPRADKGNASRFFYAAKPSKKDRDEGVSTQEMAIVTFATANGTSGKASSLSEGRNTAYRNNHPTVKSTPLMAYLCRLITPPGGTVLDPFNGSGSTGKGAIREGFTYIGIDQEVPYIDITRQRLAHEAGVDVDQIEQINMSKNGFARIFDLPLGQVLVTLEVRPSKGQFDVLERARTQDKNFKRTNSYETEAEARTAFHSYLKGDAEAFMELLNAPAEEK